MAFELVNSETIYQGRVFSLRKDQIRLPDGKLAFLDIVDHPPAVTMVPVDDLGQIWFIRQHRHSAGGILLELPAGVMEAGEEPEVSAQRETREEIGMAASHIHKLGEFWMAAGYSTEFMYVFLATGLSESPLESDADEFITIEKIPIPKAYKMAEAGQILDSKTLAALLLARPKLLK